MGIILVKAWKRNQEVEGYTDHFWAEARTMGVGSPGPGRLWRQAEPSSWRKTHEPCSGKQDGSGDAREEQGRAEGRRAEHGTLEGGALPLLPSPGMGVGKDVS